MCVCFFSAATLFNLAATIAFAWSSPSLPKLMAPGGPILITVNKGTWIVLTLKFGNLIAPIPAAWMMDRYVMSKLITEIERYDLLPSFQVWTNAICSF